jgi:4,5-dihydroxyphthalate decarboxylase
MMTNELALTVALQDYDHVRDLVQGVVRTPGLKLNFLNMPVPQMSGRFVAHREWEVSEVGLGKYTALKGQGDDSVTAIPVFPARAFRHTGFYVPGNSKLRRLEDLAGLRVGIPEWAQTAVIYARGILMHDAGVPLASIHWIQAGVNEPGRREKVAIQLPEGVVLEPRPDTSLDALLRAGDVDAVISAQPPAAFASGHPSVRRLLEDPRPLEESYWKATGIFPIMHLVAIRQDVLDAHPWVAGNLLAAFEEAKRRSVARLTDSMILRFPLPWVNLDAERAREMFGGDFWPYGLDENRTTLQAFLDYAFEQGVASRQMAPEDLFTPTTHKPFRI